MKILIGYDGSRSAEAALDDLPKAGLPDAGEAELLTVAEVWMPPSRDKPQDYLPTAIPEWLKRHEYAVKKAVIEAESLVRHAGERLQIKFPGWNVGCTIKCGSPAQEILLEADVFKPDLIVVGSYGKTAISRILLGSISNKVLSQARVSVRVARGRIEVDPVPVRIIIGYDGSPGADAAVDAVASRKWREQSEVRLVSATNSLVPPAIGRFVSPVAGLFEEEKKSDRIWVGEMAEAALFKLNGTGLKADLIVEPGNPKQVLIEEAEKWGADAIFVGSYSFGKEPEHFFTGCTSAAIAERAQCSVEVIRKL